DRVDVFGGYQYLHIGGGNSNGPSTGQGFNGWDANATANVSKYFGIEGDFGGAYATIQGVSFKTYTYAGGPVVFVNADRIKPFAHVLIGGIRLSGSESGVSLTENGYTVVAGGGVDVKANRLIAVRLMQVDWLYYNFSSTTVAGTSVPGFSGKNNVRIATGIVFRF
ncbi:MAG: hypothetical protein WCC04_19655, partial [Terriglobales bacterium]